MTCVQLSVFGSKFDPNLTQGGGEPLNITDIGDDELLTTKEAAHVLNVNPGTLYRWASAGTGPARMRMAGRWRYPRRKLSEWIIDQHESRPYAS